MRPGSVLHSLYPLSRHEPDRCLICGQSFQNHLASWWFARLYTPYDLYIDGVRKEGTTTTTTTTARYGCDDDDSGDYGDCKGKKDADRSWWFGGRNKVRSNNAVVEPENAVLAYHRRYVQNWFSTKPPPPTYDYDTRKQKNPKRHEQNRAKTARPNNGDSNNNPVVPNRYETRESGGIRYTVPMIKTTGLRSTFQLSILAVAREIVLLDLDALVHLQRLENKLIERKLRFSSS